jgi:hypothetical protein
MANDAAEMRIYVDVINGVSKSESRVKLTPELEVMWDEAQAWVNEVLAKNPNAVFEVPGDWPAAYEPRL